MLEHGKRKYRFICHSVCSPQNEIVSGRVASAPPVRGLKGRALTATRDPTVTAMLFWTPSRLASLAPAPAGGSRQFRAARGGKTEILRPRLPSQTVVAVGSKCSKWRLSAKPESRVRGQVETDPNARRWSALSRDLAQVPAERWF